MGDCNNTYDGEHFVVYSSIGSLAYKMNKSTESYLFKQIGFIVLGVLIIYFAHRVNYTIYSRVATILFLISIPLLIYTLKFGSSINEANRWIKLPVINMTFQTSDLAKLALFMYMSRQLSRRQNVIKDFKKGFLPLMVPVIIICLLDCSCKFIYRIINWRHCNDAYVYWKGEIKTYYAGCWLGINSVFLLILIATHYYNKEDHTSKDLPSILTFGRMSTWIKRVQDFMYSDKSDASYQVQQAKIAIAKGGWLGKGPGKSEQRNFLPHPYSDFIYAIIIEEYGLAGGQLLF